MTTNTYQSSGTGDRFLLIVYNADRGFFNAVSASAHKLISPNTYKCPLCEHTFGITGMLKPWKEYLDIQPLTVSFTHRNDFHKDYPQHKSLTLPAVLLVDPETGITQVLEANAVRNAKNLSDLISMMEERLDALEIK